MHVVMHAIRIGHQAKLAELGLHALLGYAFNRALIAQSIADEVGNRSDLEPVLARENLDLRAARHAAVVIHEFAQHARRLQAREHAQIHCRLRVTGSDEYATACLLYTSPSPRD